MKAFYFAGRKDQTKVVEETDDGILQQISTIEEHISLIREPGGSYLGHVSPSSSNAESFPNAILDFCYEKTIDLPNLDWVGCDGCPTNTGKHNGIIRRMEKVLERSQRIQRGHVILEN